MSEWIQELKDYDNRSKPPFILVLTEAATQLETMQMFLQARGFLQIDTKNERVALAAACPTFVLFQNRS